MIILVSIIENDATQPWDLWAAHLLAQSRRCSVTDIAQLLLSGFVIRSSDKWIEGESIKLGDGTTGTITYLGAFEMHIRGKRLPFAVQCDCESAHVVMVNTWLERNAS